MRHTIHRCACVLMTLTLAAGAPAIRAAAIPTPQGMQIGIGKSYQFDSQIMSAPVTYLVHTPASYQGTDRPYPIVILLDGDEHFAHVSAASDFLAEAGRIPEVLVVGVNNVNRAANLTPPSPHPTAAADPNDPTTPDADRFVRFISEELIPEIDRKYRTQHYRVLMGHSLGGLFVVYSLLQRPDVFSGYVAISPAINQGDEWLLDATPAFLESHQALRADVFLALGDESGRMLANTWKLSALLAGKQSSATPSLRWRLKRYPDDDHGSVSLTAMQAGLRAVFDGWFLDDADAMTLFDLGGMGAIQKRYAAVSERMGYLVPVPRDAFDTVYDVLLRRNRYAEARLVLEQAILAYPDHARFYFEMGQWYYAKGDRARGLEYFTKALQIAPADFRNAVFSYKIDASKLLPEITPSAALLRAYAGTYRAADESWRLHAESGTLVMTTPTGNCSVRFLSDLRFYCGSLNGTFEKEPGGRIRRLLLSNEDLRRTLSKVN